MMDDSVLRKEFFMSNEKTRVPTEPSLALHTDLYQINMMKTYWELGKSETRAVFECYFREMPFGHGYAIFAGLERLIHYLDQLSFSEEDLAYLKETFNYPEEFIDYLRHFKFKASVRSMREGEVVFANEPLIQVEGPLAHCQLIETALLNFVNYHTLIATKASRIKSIVGEDPLLEFGSRRAQEMDAAIWGTRAAYIGGCDATSNILAGKYFDIPVKGTHAHALVQVYQNDYDAFKAYAMTHKDCIFLVDTYDTLKSGVPSAIRVAQEMGDQINFLGVRIDSGDMAYISKRVREQLDQAGFFDAKIYASNDLDERTILNLKMQNAKIDVWGVGTKLITAFDQPALGAVYKIVAIENHEGVLEDTIKLSNNAEKVTTPGKKQVWRITQTHTGKSEGDYITLWDEVLNPAMPLYMFHPIHTYIHKHVHHFSAEPLLHEIYDQGHRVYELPHILDIKAFSKQRLANLWEEYKRDLNPQEYPVDLSKTCWDRKMSLIHKVSERNSAL